VEGNASIPDLLAAFVEPNDPAVATILRKASDLLRAQGKPDGLEGYQASSKQRLWEQAAAVWSAVCSLDIRYVNPPPSFEREGQRIRPPRQILEERLASGHRRFSVIAGAAVAVEEFGNLVARGRQADDRELRVQTR
jgi:hypothetical protein